MSLSSLPTSRNKEHDRRMAIDEITDIFNDSIKRSFQELHDIFFMHSRLEGVAHDKYGEYVCMNVPIICESLRSLDPNLFDHKPAEEIAQDLIKAVEEHDAFHKITQLCLHDFGFLTFRLSPEWMIRRIMKMISEGMDTWAPVIYRESVVVHFPAPDIRAHQHAEDIRSCYIKEMAIRMFDYSGVNVGPSLINKESKDAVRKCFSETRGEIISRRRKTPLFSIMSRDKANNFCEDLQSLWSAIYTLRGRLVIYVTPVRRREYVLKCFDAAKDEEWLSKAEWNPKVLYCCGYRAASDEREKLDYVWKIWEGRHSKMASLVKLGYAAGYASDASMECAIKYTYLKTHRLVQCTFDIDDMLNEEGNTFVCLLKTKVLISSLSENSGGGDIMVEYTEEFCNKERELVLHLVQFTEVLQRACFRLLLHPVCKYTWILCKKFMSYYNEVMELLDQGTYKSKFFLCHATELVLQKCFDLLGITPEYSLSVSSRVSNVRTGFEIILRSPLDPRPNNVNPRFEMFGMNIAIADSSFKEGVLHGVISLVDADGLHFDERLPLNTNEHGHVSYFYREWYDPIGIRNNAFVKFGSPSPCHLVPFSSIPLDIYMRLYVATTGKCFLLCNCLQDIELSEIWEKPLDHKLGTAAFKVDDGSILINYIAIRDAVDVTIKLSLVSPCGPLYEACVSGCIWAYYDGTLDNLDVLSSECYKAIIFNAAEVKAITEGNSEQQSVPAKFGSVLKVGPLSLQKSIMAVPVNGALIFEARFYDDSGKFIVRRTKKFSSETKERRWIIHLIEDECSLELTLEWSHGRVAHN